MNNILLQTDCYKMSHMEMYCPGTDFVYSYLTARSSKHFQSVLFNGLQYYLKEYLSKPIVPEMCEEFLDIKNRITGKNSDEVIKKITSLGKLGYWPIKIKAVPEGTVLSPRQVLMTICNTHPDFYWTVGFIESLLLKLWYPITVASCCLKYRLLIEKYFKQTCDEKSNNAIPFMVHDFGYRGDSSEEGAALSGFSHLLSFVGSDTIPAFNFARKYYNAELDELIMASVPASEHSCMSSYGRENELTAFELILDTYPTGIVSIVSDTYNIYRVLTEFMEKLKTKILLRQGKTVIRPDSGDPEHIICGDPNAEEGSLAWMGALRLLERTFGSTTNKLGFKVLNEKIGLIYGDGMYYERYEKILDKMKSIGFATENLVIGVGGILRNHSRDTLDFAIKATYVKVNGKPREIEKDPVTDPKKRSVKGLIRLDKDYNGDFYTRDQVSPQEEDGGQLQKVFENGNLIMETSLREIRQKVNSYILGFSK